jgi:hypothetical protein
MTYSAFDLNVHVESTTGGTGITGRSKTKHPRVLRDPRGLLFLNTQLKTALRSSLRAGHGLEARRDLVERLFQFCFRHPPPARHHSRPLLSI